MFRITNNLIACFQSSSIIGEEAFILWSLQGSTLMIPIPACRAHPSPQGENIFGGIGVFVCFIFIV